MVTVSKSHITMATPDITMATLTHLIHTHITDPQTYYIYTQHHRYDFLPGLPTLHESTPATILHTHLKTATHSWS